MIALVADTHAILWYLIGSPRLTPTALHAMTRTLGAGDTIAIATITLVETVYLADKGRVLRQSLAALLRTLRDPGSGFTPVSLDVEMARMVRRIARSQVPDMPDRIIAATALRLGLPLVTADHKIRTSGLTTIW